MKKEFYNELIKSAIVAKNNGDIPIAAIIIDKNNKIVSKQFNTKYLNKKIHEHAEINCINYLINKLDIYILNEYEMITLMEPCKMCFSVLEEARLKKISYLISNNKYGFLSNSSVNDVNIKIEEIGTKEQKEKYIIILKSFFNDIRNIKE